MDRTCRDPIASETSGVIGEINFQLLKTFGSKVKMVTQEKRSTSYLIQRVAITIQRGNVGSILETLPQTKSFI